jgi:negative regulator of sigma E activity
VTLSAMLHSTALANASFAVAVVTASVRLFRQPSTNSSLRFSPTVKGCAYNAAFAVVVYLRKSFAAASLSLSRSRPIFRIRSRACSSEMSCFCAK